MHFSKWLTCIGFFGVGVSICRKNTITPYCDRAGYSGTQCAVRTGPALSVSGSLGISLWVVAVICTTLVHVNDNITYPTMDFPLDCDRPR